MRCFKLLEICKLNCVGSNERCETQSCTGIMFQRDPVLPGVTVPTFFDGMAISCVQGATPGETVGWFALCSLVFLMLIYCVMTVCHCSKYCFRVKQVDEDMNI